MFARQRHGAARAASLKNQPYQGAGGKVIEPAINWRQSTECCTPQGRAPRWRDMTLSRQRPLTQGGKW
ncbi:hypothetical protein [Aeromonas popoffii]|uniref:hypothetical protein n=1 Tax=Aeromonas popoffii TaxID=70856 RepID=UPI003F67D0AC